MKNSVKTPKEDKKPPKFKEIHLKISPTMYNNVEQLRIMRSKELQTSNIKVVSMTSVIKDAINEYSAKRLPNVTQHVSANKGEINE